MPASSKRRRESVGALLTSGRSLTEDAASLRAELLRRTAEDFVPACLLRKGNTTGGTGVGQFMRHIGHCITAALSDLTSASETAQADLRRMRSVLHAAIDARCDELELSISSAVARKVSHLEQQLVTLDVTLERTERR